MATAEQIKSLVKSHYSNDSERFYTIALQVAAQEAKKGNDNFALELRKLLDRERTRKKAKSIAFTPDLEGLILKEESNFSRSSLVISPDLKERINQVIHEYRQQEKLKAFGLSHKRKILLVGPPGTGKTMTAKVLAYELRLPLYSVQVDRLVTKFMGETSAKLRLIFNMIQHEHGVYFFDEFDAIGGERTLDNDVGEMRRVLNSFLQFIDQDQSDSLIIAATNNPQLLDHALFRRFDDVLYYENPDEKERKELIENLIAKFKSKKFIWKNVIAESKNLSHAEIDLSCKEAIKKTILEGKLTVTDKDLLEAISYRNSTKK